jgi:(+)-trans-carveol dehydrogenase
MSNGLLEGKVAFVTGAARGQGRSHAVRLAEEGAAIIAIDICSQIESVPYPMSSAADLSVTQSLVEGVGAQIVALEADVRNQSAIDAAVKIGFEAFGRLDVVSANAGIVSFGDILEMDDQTWQDVIDVNLTGVWHTCKATVPYIRKAQNGGSVILTGSAAALKASPGLGHYVAAKTAIVGLTRSLALSLAPEMIRVNSIHPSCVDTPMVMNQATLERFVPMQPQPTREDLAKSAQRLNALPIPWVDPLDVSSAVVFLASDLARYITGVELPVDAGMSIR